MNHFKEGDIVRGAGDSARILGKKVLYTKHYEAFFTFVFARTANEFLEGLKYTEYELLQLNYEKVSIKDLPEDIKEAYVKWKLDQL